VAVLAALSAEPDGATAGARQADASVNGGAAQTLSFTPTGSFTTVGAKTIFLTLAVGSNTIEFSNPTNWAPDLNEIVVAPSP
jgi:hypothetical protein